MEDSLLVQEAILSPARLVATTDNLHSTDEKTGVQRVWDSPEATPPDGVEPQLDSKWLNSGPWEFSAIFTTEVKVFLMARKAPGDYVSYEVRLPEFESQLYDLLTV